MERQGPGGLLHISKFGTSTCESKLRESKVAWAFVCSPRYMSMEGHIFLLPVAREMTALANGSKFHKFPRNSGFYLTTRNPTVQLQLFSAYIDCLWGLRK